MIDKPVDDKKPDTVPYRLVHITVENESPPLPWRLFTNRQIAWSSEIVIDVYEHKNKNFKN